MKPVQPVINQAARIAALTGKGTAMSDLIRRHTSQICMVNCGLPEDQCACMTGTPDTPERIWADGPEIFDDMGLWYTYESKGHVEYIRADTVQAQIDAARDASLREAADEVLKLITGHKKSTLADAHLAILALLWKGGQP